MGRGRRRAFWLAWLLGMVAIAGLLIVGTGNRELPQAGEALLRPIDAFARGQFGEPYLRATEATGSFFEGPLRAMDGLAQATGRAFEGIAGSVGATKPR